MIRVSSLLIAVPIALAAQQPAGDGARPVALDEAVRLAQRNAPAAVTARNTLRTTAAAVSLSGGLILKVAMVLQQR